MSAFPRDHNAGAKAVAVGDQYFNAENAATLKLSPRQIELNRRYAWYCAEQYDARGVEWDGSKRLSQLDREQFAHGASTPAGWKDFGRAVPLRFRRPAVGYHLVRIIVQKFTAMLFSEDRHPTVGVAGDVATDDYVKALIEASRFWARWKEARNQGGAMGTSIVGFKFVNGMPRLEVFDPRWARPTFIDREAFELGALDIRYPFDTERRDENGKWVKVKQWHRRYLDERIDVVFEPLDVTDEEPRHWPVKDSVEHRLGFCPAVWVQNQPVGDDIDGEPDVVGAAIENNEAIDALYSQAHASTIANMDPTLILKTNEPLDKVRKGSDNAIKLEQGGDASYLDLQATGPKSGRELAAEIKDMVLEASSCVLERPDDVAKTATEIQRRFASMTAQAATLREQYSDYGIKPLIRKMTTAARALTGGRPQLVQVPANAPVGESPTSQGSTTAPDDNPKTNVVQGQIFLPPKVEVDPNTGAEKLVPRKIGPGPIDVVRVRWPQFFEPTPADATAAVGAASAAFAAKIIDLKTAADYIAPYFKVEDVDAMLRKIQEAGSGDADMMNAAMGQMAPPDGAPPNAPPALGGPPPQATPPGEPPAGPSGPPAPGAPPGATPPPAAGWGVLGKS